MKKNNRGFTLVETLTALAIISIMALAISSFFSNSLSVRKIDTQLSLQLEAKSALALMSKEIREAKDLRLPNVRAESISFEEIDGGATISYRLTGKELIREEIINNLPLRRQLLLKDVQISTALHPIFTVSVDSNVIVSLYVERGKTFIHQEKRVLNRNGGIKN